MPEDAAESRLTLEVERNDDAATVKCSGKLVAGVTEFLYTKVSGLIPETKRIVLDLSDVTHMDSMGLGTVVRLYVSARSGGCELQLVNFGDRIRELLGITNLLSVFSICGEHGARLP